jgi:hypothetical protein
VRGAWPARDGSERIELATATRVASWPRDLAGPSVAQALPPLGELIASRGDRRLVRATTETAVVLDRAGVRAYVPLAAASAVLGEDNIIAASATVRRSGVPRPWHRPLRVPPARAAVAVPAELRDLPAVAELDDATAIAAPGGIAANVSALALDGATAFAAAGDRVARFDIAARAWRWTRADGCGAHPIALAVARDVVVCAARDSVRATARDDGAARWMWTAAGVDAIAAAADVAVAFAGDRAIVLDARTGRSLGAIASDDGGRARAAVLAIDGTAIVIAAERGRVVARLPRAAMMPAWSVAVAGVVRSISPAGDGALVELDDGDAYRIDARTAAIVALPALFATWHASRDAIAAEAIGGVIPPPALPEIRPLPPPPVVRPRCGLPKESCREDEEWDGSGCCVKSVPPIAIPWRPPAPIGASWQLALFELDGGVRARDDYALARPIAVAPRAPGAPYVIAYGGRELLVVEPRRGDPVQRARLPEGAAGAAFATVAGGKPVVGVVLGAPLRVVLF